MSNRLPLVAALTLPMLLAACGNASVPAPTPASGDSLDITLTAPFPAAAPQGLPTDASGASTVKTITVKVKNGLGQVVTFNGQNVYQAGGSQSTLTLSSSAPSLAVRLPRGSYTFENVGKSSGGTFLAYGTNPGIDLTQSANTTINLALHALASEAKTTFSDKMNWTSVVPQDILDLRLNVLNVDGTLVPTTDYETPTYQVVDSGGNAINGVATVLSGSSKLGARVQVIGPLSTNDLYVKATTKAWLVTGTDTAALGSLSKIFRIPFDKTTVQVDVQAPKVTFNGILPRVTAGQTVALSGNASDDSGNIQAIRVYNGSQLIGSTEGTEYGQSGVGEIGYTGSAWTLRWTPGSSGTPDITVIAADKSGNEGRAVGLTFAQSIVAAGGNHNLAIRPNGTVAAWGYNGLGQTSVPTNLNSIVGAAAGYYHSLAVRADGTVAAWGYNYYGQASVPANLSGVIAVAAGYYHSLALKSDGTVVSWGYNGYGQTSVPANLTGVVAVAAGYGHSLALKSDGTVVVWGSNPFGQTNVPANLSGVVAISSSFGHSLALKSDGTVVAWGYNVYGQTNMPANLSGVVAVAAGEYHSLALKADGTVVAWGYNASGQTNVPANLNSVVAISAGENHSLALKSDGTIVVWGSNGYGQANVPAGPYLVP
ncbi:RCC1 domain-containing protein [Deinococcus sp.]|uniref:RCC1 domain-containing protein n=1 Tax=Deinococcus sp. TaxID=47478 RepID=UPI003B5A5062